jgi:hypothetical protein
VARRSLLHLVLEKFPVVGSVGAIPAARSVLETLGVCLAAENRLTGEFIPGPQREESRLGPLFHSLHFVFRTRQTTWGKARAMLASSTAVCGVLGVQPRSNQQGLK